jgi:hypothetical protein
MINAAPCIMLLMRVASITRASGRGLGPGIETFLAPVKWHRADRRVPFGAQKSRNCAHQDEVDLSNKACHILHILNHVKKSPKETGKNQKVQAHRRSPLPLS